MKRKEGYRGRRVRITCRVEIQLETGEIHHGTACDLGVDGVTFLTDYVPRFEERLELRVIPPEGSLVKPLRAMVQVQSCIQIVQGAQYEIDGLIQEVRE